MKRAPVARHSLEVVGAAGFGVAISQHGSVQLLSVPFGLAVVASLVWLWFTVGRFPGAEVAATLSSLMRVLTFDNESSVRCTVHVPTKTKYRQAIDYVPGGKGTAGRKFSMNKGIVGRAIRNKERFAENFVSDDDYRTRMVLEYGYTTDEVGKRSADRRSYFCVPLINADKVIGVLFFDSRTPGTFTLDASTIPEQTILKVTDYLRDLLL